MVVLYLAELDHDQDFLSSIFAALIIFLKRNSENIFEIKILP